ncbi:hypothetical protein B0I35DRAFT_464253 [Stachybotrys elegans]|uniref:Endoplasmic reticulum junction formation protein lunapark n=1 Tax=Stachybotrys elegans TaxID=80388 RepID=A0A8K0SIS5_9HYPO|nr:hypothetical protein B0I35DRAFT_464253 [Stachybotrys elegans]
MVSLWPWGSSDSTASFEKTLSALSVKIADTQSRLDRLRTSSRRIRLLSAIYMVFAYLVYAIVLLLVVGYKNMGPYEWTGIAGGPVLIYTTRTALATYYSFRIESLTTRVDEQREEREKTIQKLKEATKYDSTLELIEKYGGAEKKRRDDDEDDNAQKRPVSPNPNSRPGFAGRTNLPPPRPPISDVQAAQPEPGAEFAPNAEYYPEQPAGQPVHSMQPSQHANIYGTPHEPHWYDRLFELLLGDDETAPKNRIALICRACRLVNGQAPPGTKSLADLGKWKCMACGAVNNEADEGRRLVKEALQSKLDDGGVSPSTATNVPEIEVGEEFKSEDDDDEEEDEGPAAAVKKRRGKGGR